MMETQELPQVTLDTTLAELYARGNSKDNKGQIALVLCAANSEIAPSSMLARNTKFLYQDSTFITTPESVGFEQQKEIQRAVAVRYMSLVPQHDAFAAGNMPVILFDLDISGEETSHSKQEAEKTVKSLTTLQRPRLLFFPGPKQILMEENGIGLLVPKMDLDELEGFPLAMDLDTHYFLNSKSAICTSGLPRCVSLVLRSPPILPQLEPCKGVQFRTSLILSILGKTRMVLLISVISCSPKSRLLELEDFSASPESCCAVCRLGDGNRFIPSTCVGTRGQWLKSQITRILSELSIQPLPFVLKNQQTFGGGGTFAISTPEDLSELKTNLSTRILPKLLSQVNSSNAHLKPATLVVSNMVINPIGDWGLTFFVTRAGECVFLSLTQQIINPTKAWIGSTVSYTAQDRLKEKFTPIMREVGTWLRKYDYYGPCGVDILEAVSTNDNIHSMPALNVVDLNVRTSGSLVLGLMKGHFSERRGLHEASSFSVNVKMSRDSFIKNFGSQFREGKIVIVSWYEDVDFGVSFANVVIGAKNKEELEREVARVKEVASEIHF